MILSEEHMPLDDPRERCRVEASIDRPTVPAQPAREVSLRWLVAYRPQRQPRFGETRRDVSAWMVVAYALTDSGRRVYLHRPFFFPSRARALSSARSHAAAYSERLKGAHS